MGTRSYIGLESEDGSIEFVYCHWDGYPSGVGATLLEHYRDREKVKRLLSLGSLSSLSPEIGEQHDFDDLDETPSTFYRRDRGDALRVETAEGRFDFDAKFDESWCEYAYLLTSNGWIWRGANTDAWPFKIPRSVAWAPLTKEDTE